VGVALLKTFVLIRHAKSSWTQPELTDRQRPLKARGERDAVLMRKYLRSRDWSFDRCYSSPAVRAEQTAQCVAGKLGLDIVTDEELYTFSYTQLLDWLRHLDNDLQTVLAFGHNPAITDLVNYLAATDIENTPTCGLAKLDFDLDNWAAIEQGMARLDALVVPKALR
jgi:phosphohistidine phosphatase